MAETSLESLTEGKASGPYVMENVGFDEGKTGGPDLPPDTLQPDPPKQSIEDMTKPPQALVDLQRQRTGDVEAERQRQSVILDQDQAIIRKRFAQTGIEPGTLEPWDNNKQREKYRTDPIESFGSLGSVFAMVASAFTRAPMENALNGAAAAMNAIKAGNEQEFQLAHRAWKENTDLALKRHDIMQRQYENAIQLMSSDVAAGRAKMTMLAASYDDQQMLGLMNAGLWPQGLELMEKRNNIAIQNRKILEGDQEEHWKRETFKAELENNKRIQDPFQKALADQKAAYKIYGWGRQPDTIPQQEYATELQRNPGLYETVDKRIELGHRFGLMGRPLNYQQERFAEIQRRAAKYMLSPEEGGQGLSQEAAFDKAAKEVSSNFVTGGGSGSASTANRMRTAEEVISNNEAALGEKLSPDEKNLIHKVHEDRTSAGSSKTIAVGQYYGDLQKRKENGENVSAMDRLNGLQKKLEGHDDQEEAVAIAQYRQKPFTGWAAASGRGAKIMSDVHKLNPDYDEKTWTATSAVAKVGSTANVLALSGALKQLEKMYAAVGSFEKAERPNIELLVELAKKVDATGIPALDRWVLAGRQATGDVDVQAFHTQYAVTIPGVARIISQPNLTGQLTDAARRELSEGIPYPSSSAQLRASVDILLGDMDRRKKGLEDQIEKTNQRIKETFSKPTPQAVTYTGKTATNPTTGKKLRETTDGRWVE